MSSFVSDMAEHEDIYQEAEAASGPPIFTDGQHQAIITVSRVENSEFGWQWVLSFRGQDAKTGKPASIRKWTNLPPEDETRAGYLKSDLQRLGYDGSLSGLEQACIEEQFIGLVTDIGVKTKTGQERDYTNVFINRSHGKVDVEQWLASRGGSSEAVDAPHTDSDGFDRPPPLADDDIPF